MPSLNILRESPVYDTFRSQQIMGMFDLPKTKKQKLEWKVDLPIEDFKWDIGLIVGPSGSGKSTIAGEVFGNIHTGFDADAIKKLLDMEEDQAEVDEVEEKFEIIVECKNETEQKESYDKLKKEGYQCRVLTF